MNNSGVERTHDFPADKAKGHIVIGGSIKRAQRNYLAYAKGGGDMYATARDILKWDQALYRDQYLSHESKKLLFDGDPEIYGGYGYGFKVKFYNRGDNKSGKLVRHGGSMYGYVSNVHRYLDDKLTIIILGNIRPYPTMEITTKIEGMFLDSARN
jgi:CubicO group peptidase (beta-lactamase class C family)